MLHTPFEEVEQVIFQVRNDLHQEDQCVIMHSPIVSDVLAESHMQQDLCPDNMPNGERRKD